MELMRIALEQARMMGRGTSVRMTEAWKAALDWNKHHILPKQFMCKFNKILGKTTIEDYTLTVPDWFHKWLHYGSAGGWWNQQWKNFFTYYEKLHRDPTPKEVVQYMRQMLNAVGLHDVKIHELIK